MERNNFSNIADEPQRQRDAAGALYSYRDGGDWVEFTFYEEDGSKIQTISYPKEPMISEATLQAVEDEQNDTLATA
ncbi:hypothetical protein SAMN05444157_0726 [Frankineae bacterium MT45]|nr:hypothetical protein SAMN05444157_0726 [Frankineae bacterium MT45]